MTDLSRREALALTAALSALAALPSGAFAEGPAAGGEPPSVWDLSDLYASDAAWSAERDAVEKAAAGLAAYKGRLGESAATLRAALGAISDLNKRANRLGTYAGLKADEDLGVAANQERRSLSIALFGKLAEATAWVNPEILTMGRAKIERFLAADPGLARFRFGLLDVLRLAPHTLDPAGEALLALSAQVQSGPNDIRSQLFLSDIPWPEIELPSGGKARIDSQGYTAKRGGPDRAERKLVMDTFFKEMSVYESSLGSALSAQVQVDIFGARARKYDSAVAAALAPNNIPVPVYRTLVAEANAGLPVLQRYFDLRRRMLGLKDMAYYDVYPPATKLDRRFSLGEIRALTLEAVKPLGQDYVDTLAKATAGHWMHARPQKGKAAGAYMNGSAYDVHPYLLLNLTDDYESLTTFAHEWGHAMHTLLADKAQPYDTSGYPTFTAEIASTLNEQLLNDFMLKGAKTKEEKLFYLDRTCELLRGTFYRQTMFAEFELAIHEAAEKGEALSGNKMTAMYLAILKKYHEPVVSIDPAYGIEWAFPQHFYFDFYVFQYATCVSASTFFADRVLGGKAADRDAYLGVLKAGGSDYPVEVLKRAGLDMTTPAPYRAVVAKLARTVDQMEALLKGRPPVRS
ncbi:MAG: oligoendopeptidase F family protein [Proteobacteria bacterium]|nr:oligoendopeptidase F family protein [Pseudomonadota bacterium]